MMLSTLLGIYCFLLFFFNDTAITEIYTLSIHDALPIYFAWFRLAEMYLIKAEAELAGATGSSTPLDRKSTRLNSSHDQISYAGFFLKKKKLIDSTRNYKEPFLEKVSFMSARVASSKHDA